jgi:DNA repair photolyase
MSQPPQLQDEVRTGKDPTKAILSKSSLNGKYLCDYSINVATGCRHGCKFCYVPSTPQIRARPDMLEKEADVQNSQKEWGSYVLYRDDLPERLDEHLDRKRTWRETEGGCGIVGISFSTDCYMDGRAGRITRGVVESLASHDKYARVLTRNPILALQDVDVFEQAGEYVTVGSSIPTLDRAEAAAIEPQAPAPEHRLRGLEEFNKYGVQTYVSVSPTYPTMDSEDIRGLLQRVAECDPDVVFHEPINPRAGNAEMCIRAAREAGELELANELETLRDVDQWVDYSVAHLKSVQKIGTELGLPIHLWPDKELLKHSDSPVSDWLRRWRERQSPEEFAGRDTPERDLPEIPN